MTTSYATARAAFLRRYFAAQNQVEDLLARTDLPEEPRARGFSDLSAQIVELQEQYRHNVPVLPLSRCPFSGAVTHHSIDPYGLDGLWWNYSAPIRPAEKLPETYFAVTGAIGLAEPVEHAPFLCRPGAGAPYVMPHMLAHADVKAVVSTIGVGRHRAYAIFYFADPEPPDLARTNSWGTDHYRFHDADGTECGARLEPGIGDADFELEPWIRSGQLLWIAPGDETLTLCSTISGCPYLAMPGDRGFYRIYEGNVWSDTAVERLHSSGDTRHE